MGRLIFHPEAEGEYRDAFKWYEARSPRAAFRFEAEVEGLLTRIVTDTESFPRYDAKHRFAIVKRFPYSIVYQTIFSDIYIAAVAHASRSPGYWQHREESR